MDSFAKVAGIAAAGLLLSAIGPQRGAIAEDAQIVRSSGDVVFATDLVYYQENGADQPEGNGEANGEPAETPGQPSTGDLFAQPTSVAAAPPAPMTSLLSQLQAPSPQRQAELGGGTSANIISGADVAVLGTTDTGDLLTSSIFNTGVFSAQLSPVMTSTRVRGYRYSQIQTTLEGAPWFPVRPDADTPLSRFDSHIVEDVAIIRGPYNVRLGPGFAFIDVSLRDTPRHEHGFEAGGETKFTWDTNGEQYYGRQVLFGGGVDRGWRIGYGHKGGVDYEAGDGQTLASGYKVRDWDFAYGLDLTDSSSVEFTYIRTEMTDVELPGQINDFRSLVSDGFGLRYIAEDDPYFDRFSINGWYNITDFAGSVDNKNFDPEFPDFFLIPESDDRIPPGADRTIPRFRSLFDPFLRVVTSGETSSAGWRTMMSWGDPEYSSATLGADVTFFRQTYFERRLDTDIIDFGVPFARQTDGGIFLDGRQALTDRLMLKAGGRIDFVRSTADPNDQVDARDLALQKITPACIMFDLPCVHVDVLQRYTLGAGYLSADYELNEALTLSGGVGYAERAPSPTDLYGDLPHLSIMQEGAFFIPHGNLLLGKERALQTDLGATMEYDFFRGGVFAFYSLIDDFITYTAPHLPPPSGPHEVHAIGTNTEARMAGGEFYGELNLTQSLAAFGTLSYVQGKDLVLDEPLWGIPPLDTRMGLRLVDVNDQRWGLEYILRLVDDQDRISDVGFIGELPTPGFNTHNVRGYYLLSERAALIAGVENIGDAFYREHLDTRLNLTQGSDPARGVVRRGVSFYFALQAEY